MSSQWTKDTSMASFHSKERVHLIIAPITTESNASLIIAILATFSGTHDTAVH